MVVTSSVRIGGVLLVCSYLIVPALAGILVGGGVGTRIAVGWAFGALVSVVAMLASAALDLPTGATVVCAFGAALLLLGGIAALGRGRRSVSGAALAAGPRRPGRTG